MFNLNLLNSGLEQQLRPHRPESVESDELSRPPVEPPEETSAPGNFTQLPLLSQSLDYSQKQSLSLQLQTRDGDQIELSFSSLNALSQSQRPGQFQQTTISGSQLQLSITGDLNEGELEDLNEFLGQVEELASSFYGGDLAGAFSLAQEFDISGTELASFSLDMQSRTQVRQVQEYRAVEGKPSLPSSLMQQMGNYLNDLMETAETASRISPAQDLLQPVLDWLDQGDQLFSSFNKSYLDELMPQFASFRERDDD